MVFEKGHVVSKDTRQKMSIANKGKHMSEETEFKTGHAAWNKGKKASIESRKKMSEACKGRKPSEEQRRKMSESHKGKPSCRKGKHHSEKSKKLISIAHKGKKLSDQHKESISKGLTGKYTGERSHSWVNGISFEPYCKDFNQQLKERIRERDHRTCQLCGIKENGEKLSIHHVHYDKPNCIPDLITLCRSCNSKANHNREYHEEYFTNLLKCRGLINE